VFIPHIAINHGVSKLCISNSTGSSSVSYNCTFWYKFLATTHLVRLVTLAFRRWI